MQRGTINFERHVDVRTDLKCFRIKDDSKSEITSLARTYLWWMTNDAIALRESCTTNIALLFYWIKIIGIVCTFYQFPAKQFNFVGHKVTEIIENSYNSPFNGRFKKVTQKVLVMLVRNAKNYKIHCLRITFVCLLWKVNITVMSRCSLLYILSLLLLLLHVIQISNYVTVVMTFYDYF